MGTFVAGALLLVILQILAEQVKTGRNAKIDHHHVGRFWQVVPDGGARHGNVVLREACAVIGHINREWLARGFFIPGQVITPHDLIGKTALSFELKADR